MARVNISLKQLRAFLAVTETGSFTEAAAQMNVTPSALSLLIKGLEEEIGFRVLDRTTRHVSISQAGQLIQPMAKSMLEDLDSVIQSVSEVASMRRGVVRVGATGWIACTLVAPAIAAYAKEHPNLDVRLLDTTVHTMLAMLRGGEMEVVIGPALIGSVNVGADVAVTPLFASLFSAFCTEGNPLARRRSAGWNDILRYPLIVPSFDFSSSLLPQLQEQSTAAEFGQSLSSFVEARSITNIFTGFSLASEGLGVLVAPRYLTGFARKFDLRGPKLIRPSLKRVIVAYTRKRYALSPGAEDFLRFLKQYVDERWLE